jgi:hypothetical protein
MNRSSRQRRHNAIGVALLCFVALAVIALGTFVYWLNSNKRILDTATMCPQEGPSSVSVVLLDTTDILTPVQRADVIKHLDDLKDSIPRFGQLELFAVAPGGDRLIDATMNLCNPGRGNESSWIYGNPHQAERRWQQRFSQKTDSELDALLRPHPAQTSPILESIQQVALEAFAGDKLADVPKQLIIVSDLLQNTAQISQYECIELFDRFREDPYYFKVRCDLRGVAVRILLLNRPQNGAGRRTQLIKFWKQYFADAGATNLEVSMIEG